MKREAWGHPKFRLVCRDLKLPMCYVVGVLESLWLVTSDKLPRGDIGRWSNDEIAAAIEYPGDADEFIASLLKRRLLDSLPDDGRLYVHDWHEHADLHVHARLAKAGQYFANGAEPQIPHQIFNQGTRNRIKAEYAERRMDTPPSSPDQSGHVGTSPDKSGPAPSKPEPEPEPINPTSSGNSTVLSSSSTIQKTKNLKNQELDDDDEKIPTSKAELGAVFKAVCGDQPKRKTWDVIEAQLAAHGVSMADFCAAVFPHIRRNGLTNPEGFLISFARQFRSRTEEPPANGGTGPRKCSCKFGVRADGSFCDCPTGRDLSRATRRVAAEKAEKPPEQKTAKCS